MLKRIIHKLGRRYITEVLKREWADQRFSTINEKPIQYSFVFRHLVRLRPEHIWDAGCGVAAFPSLLRDCGFLVTATDRIRGYWTEGYFNRHYHVLEDDISQTRLTVAFDLITALDMLHVVEDPAAAMRSLFGRLKPGGHLILSVMYNEYEYVPDIYHHPEGGYGRDWPYKGTIYSRRELDQWAAESGVRIVDQEHWQYFTGRLWTMGERMWPPRLATKDEPHQFTCVLFQKPAPGDEA
jgi:SAM-dependent methyltransferase